MGREFPIIDSTTERNFIGLALDGSNLYYEELTTGHAGVYVRDMATGAERLIAARQSDSDLRPVAADGVLLWQEKIAHCTEGLCTYDWYLHMLKSDGTARVVASVGENEFSSYDVSGDNVVWGGTIESPVTVYSINTGIARSVSALAGTDPHIQGEIVGWTGAPSTAPGGESGWSVKAEDLGTGVVATLVADSDMGKQVQAVAGQTRKAVVYTMENAAPGSYSLYLIYVK